MSADPLAACETAEDHARRASLLLASIDAMEKQLDGLDEDQRLQMMVSGGFKRANANLEHSVQCAIAHALTALALRVDEAER